MLNPLMELRTEVKSVDKDEKLVEHLKRLYVSCRTHYVVSRPGQRFYVPKRNGAFCPLTDMTLLKHLQHEYAVGIYAGDDGSRFICFDVDDGNAIRSDVSLRNWKPWGSPMTGSMSPSAAARVITSKCFSMQSLKQGGCAIFTATSSCVEVSTQRRLNSAPHRSWRLSCRCPFTGRRAKSVGLWIKQP